MVRTGKSQCCRRSCRPIRRSPDSSVSSGHSYPLRFVFNRNNKHIE